MFRQGVKDFAGGIVVHTTAGFSALATVMALPNRQKLEGSDVDTNPHNIPFVALGTGLLWFGWFGFNGGSALAADDSAVVAAMNSEIAASTALFFWLLLEWKMEGKPTLGRVERRIGVWVSGRGYVTGHDRWNSPIPSQHRARVFPLDAFSSSWSVSNPNTGFNTVKEVCTIDER